MLSAEEIEIARPKVMPFFEYLLGEVTSLSEVTSNIIKPGAPDGGYHVDSVLGMMPEPLPSFPVLEQVGAVCNRASGE